MQRQGRYPPPPGASDLPGLEIAGEVVALGRRRVRRQNRRSSYRVVAGRRLCRIRGGGGAAVPAHTGRPDGWSKRPRCPRRISPYGPICSIAAGAKRARPFWFTAEPAESAPPPSSSRLPGGPGCSQPPAPQRRRAPASAWGAARGIDYRTEDFVEVIRQETAGRGVDLILDMIGGSYLHSQSRGGGGGGAGGGSFP